MPHISKLNLQVTHTKKQQMSIPKSDATEQLISTNYRAHLLGWIGLLQATRLIITERFSRMASSFLHCAILPAFDMLRAGLCERRGRKLESSYYTMTTISGSHRGERDDDCSRARYWRRPLALTVCAGAHYRSPRVIYVGHLRYRERARRLAAALRDPDSARTCERARAAHMHRRRIQQPRLCVPSRLISGSLSHPQVNDNFRPADTFGESDIIQRPIEL